MSDQPPRTWDELAALPEAERARYLKTDLLEVRRIGSPHSEFWPIARPIWPEEERVVQEYDIQGLAIERVPDAAGHVYPSLRFQVVRKVAPGTWERVTLCAVAVVAEDGRVSLVFRQDLPG